MTYAQLIRHFGDYKAAAIALGLPGTTVATWKLRGIPHARQYEIAVKTGNTLKPDGQRAGNGKGRE